MSAEWKCVEFALLLPDRKTTRFAIRPEVVEAVERRWPSGSRLRTSSHLVFDVAEPFVWNLYTKVTSGMKVASDGRELPG